MSAKSRKRRSRKLRRKVSAIMKHGPGARPIHKSKSGRTGRVRITQLKDPGGRDHANATVAVPLSTSSPPATGNKGRHFSELARARSLPKGKRGGG